MRKEFVTPFWQNAYKALPAHVRGRYHTQLHAAERWELRLEALIETWVRTKQLFSRLTPAH